MYSRKDSRALYNEYMSSADSLINIVTILDHCYCYKENNNVLLIVMKWFAVHNDGRETELLALDGTLPVVIRGM